MTPISRRIASLHPAWLLPLVIGIVVLAYLPGLRGGFAFDDMPNIVDNVALRVTFHDGLAQWIAAMFSSPASDLQRPLAMLSFALNHAFAGMDPWWMKLTNIAIHALNTWLVFLVARKLLGSGDVPGAGPHETRRDWTALWVAAAWALNPINLMAVLLVVQRMESLSHTFVFAGLWCYLHGRERMRAGTGGWAWILSGLLGGTALGVLCKESAALLPLYALTVEWAVLRFRSTGTAPDRRLLVLFGLVIVLPGVVGMGWLLPRVLGPGAFAGRGFTLGERLLTEGRVVLDYLHWTLLPNLSQLSLYHDDYPASHGLLAPATTLVSLVLLALLVVAIFLLRTRRPLVALGLAWFLVAQLLTATIVPLELVFEHRNYFASFGLCLALGDALLRWTRHGGPRRVGVLTASALLFLYAGATTLRATEWRNPVQFASTEAAKHPQSPRATYSLARELVILTGFRADSPYLPAARAALDHAMAVPNASLLPETATILLEARLHQPIDQRVWTALQRKLATRPLGPQETTALGSLVDCQIARHCDLPVQPMVDSFRAALTQGRNPEVLNIFGNYALNVLDYPNIALSAWSEAARLAPNVVEYQATMARMLIASGHAADAKPYIRRVRALGRLGQNETRARELEALARQAAPQPSPPGSTLDSTP